METYNINLNNGVINAKSKFNFKTFNSILQNNVRYSLLLFLLNEVGIEPKKGDNHTDFLITDLEKTNHFCEWLEQRLNHLQEIENKKSTVLVDSI